MKKKLLFLLIALLLSRAGAFAQGGTIEFLTWEINNDTLTISGGGAIPDYDWDNFAPWYEYREAIHIIVIKNGIANIGKFAFYACNNLTTIISLNFAPALIDPSAFQDIDIKACTLKVPTSAVPAYYGAGVWGEFINIVGSGILINPITNNHEYGYTTGNELYENATVTVAPKHCNCFHVVRYEINDTATVTATAFDNHTFINWTQGGVVVSTDYSYSFTATEDVELVANFEREKIYLHFDTYVVTKWHNTFMLNLKKLSEEG